MQFIRFIVRSLDAKRTLLLARIDEELASYDEAAMLMYMVNTIEVAQEYFGAKALSDPVSIPLEDSYNDNIFYVSFEFVDGLTKAEFEYYLISSFLP